MLAVAIWSMLLATLVKPANTPSEPQASPPTSKMADGLKVAQQIAAHESSRATGLYDRRGNDVSLDEVKRIAI